MNSKSPRSTKKGLIISEEELDEKSWLLLDSDAPRFASDTNPIAACVSWLCDPNHRPYRYAIVTLLALTQGVSTYVSDLPGGLQATIIRVMKLDDAHYNMIFSAFSWPDIVMAFVGSILVNQFLGIHVGYILFLAILAFGQLMCALGGFVNSFWIFLLGRILIGCGTGTSYSALNSFQVLWFGGKEITFIMSLCRCMSRTMATLALFTPQLTYDSLTNAIPSPLNRLGAVQMIGTLLSVFSVMFALGVVLLDKYGAKFIGRKPPRKKSMSVRDVLSFPISFWIVAFVCSLYYAPVISSTANAPLFFVSKYEMDLQSANLANSLSYASIVIASPFIAIAIDWLGYNLVWCFLGLLLAVSSLLLYVGGDNSQYIPFIATTIVSMSFSVFGAAMWVTPGLVVGKHQVTTAYGTAMSIYALAGSVVGVVAGVIIDNFGYLFVFLFYSWILLIAILMTLGLFLSEALSDKRVLNVTGKQRRKYSGH